MTDDIQATAQHLLNLLDMMPTRKDAKFWQDLNEAENGGDDDGYFMSKMVVVHRMLAQYVAGAVDRVHLSYLAQYVLVFFDRDDPAMWKVLDRTAHFGVEEDGRIGRRWAEDACRAAWALYVHDMGSSFRSDHAENLDDPSKTG